MRIFNLAMVVDVLEDVLFTTIDGWMDRMVVQGRLDFNGTGCGNGELLIPVSLTSFYPPTSSIDLYDEELSVSEISGLRVKFVYHLGLCHNCG
jgi:hypothetical protein